MKKVLILYKYLPQWRVDFFNGLKDSLLNEDIELTLAYGKLRGLVTKKNDEVDLEWGKYVPNKFIKLFKTEFVWQPALKEIRGADLIIVEQANKLLINYLLILAKHFSKKKLAFWGHGINLQDDPQSIGNKFKKLYSNQCDWWFAYTKNVGNTIQSMGFPEEKITIVQNAIDTKSLSSYYENIAYTKIIKLKNELKIGDGPIGLYCGGMYKEKRLDFLLESCKNIKKEIPNFEMIFLGAGPEDYKIKQAADLHKWIHNIGPKFNNDKVPFFKLADVFLMPGLVGLAILDSFSMQTPIVTTKYPFHSPEIEYLENGINGLMVENGIEIYSNSIVDLLMDDKMLKKLKGNCKESAGKYTIENMVKNFHDGIIKVLNN